ncbi:Protein PLASTID MOVEMENT IMPAIRED 1-RELATED 1 [Camellia lanceoleosa]|uniref:Protein PLASTID MOVEMENT IMPAIRED 1-RELATED 1 n=1 Tax=Camellia lanceoleosa TaxID=1840588 RepID=A0ACC0FED2_9ERIC|nr:Protein PLASTID MOVEMENT IMPAIRED 1-RELATED 1 [Camellia lanceoleosa]
MELFLWNTHWNMQFHLRIGLKIAGDLETVITISVVVQLRDHLRRYEVVGGPVIALIYGIGSDSRNNDEKKRFKVANLHVGGLKARSKEKINEWDTEEQKLIAMQRLVAYGLGKTVVA